MLRGTEFRHAQAPSQQGAGPAVVLMHSALASHVGGDYPDACPTWFQAWLQMSSVI